MLHLKLHWLRVYDSNAVNSTQLSQHMIVEKVWPHSQKKEQLISRTANHFFRSAHLENLYTLSFLFIVILAPNKLRKHMFQWVMITSVCYENYGFIKFTEIINHFNKEKFLSIKKSFYWQKYLFCAEWPISECLVFGLESFRIKFAEAVANC